MNNIFFKVINVNYNIDSIKHNNNIIRNVKNRYNKNKI